MMTDQMFFLYISTMMSSDIRAATALLSASIVYMKLCRPWGKRKAYH